MLYKNALDDRARTIFGGLIRVEPHAHFTDAYQKVRNLLLSDDSEANSMPGLEILADNVRCTHGATSGQIDEDELFYLRTRGIPTKVAQRLLVTGFLDEVIQRLDHPAIAEHLHRLIEEKFAKTFVPVADLIRAVFRGDGSVRSARFRDGKSGRAAATDLLPDR